MLPSNTTSPTIGPIYTVTRGQKMNLQSKEAKMSYSGTFFANCFQVNQPIELTALAFFGPANGELSNYWVQLDVFESTKVYPDPSIRIAKIRMEASISSERFWIELISPIKVTPNIWYTVQFCLDDGPSTFRCEKTQNNIAVPVGSNGEKVEFNFLEGSRQMPQMQFKLSNACPAPSEKSETIVSIESETAGLIRQILGTRMRNWARPTTTT